MDNESTDRESLQFLLFSHHSQRNLSHTIPIAIFGRVVRLCARCAGIATGIGVGLLIFEALYGTFTSFPALVAIFPLPGAIDWLLQVFGKRQSTNPRRLVTGFLIGNLYVVGGASLIRASSILLQYLGFFGTAYFISLYLLFKKTGALTRYLRLAW